MSILENILLAFSGLRSGKMRSFLTMLGIIIGISSVIAIVTVGDSLTFAINDAMEQLGANQIIVAVTNRVPNSSPKFEPSDLMTEDMVNSMKGHFNGRIKAANVAEGGLGGQAKDGRRYANVSLVGTNANYLTDNNFDVIKGTDIRERDIQRASQVAVVSTKFVEKMFPPTVDPLGKEVKIHTPDKGVITFTIIGIYEYKVPAIAAGFAQDEDIQTQAIIPVTTVQRLTDTDPGYYQIMVSFPPGTDANKLATDLQEYLAGFYRSNPDFTIGTQNMESMLDQFNTMMSTVSLAISIIAGISLIVGGIGVMNIMLVSVTERTREIGTRKALGARNNAIMGQFITEAVILCLVGGLIGIVLGLILGLGGAALLGFPGAPSLVAIILAVSFSMIIGVFFGFYPAYKAALLDPIEALRYE